MGVDIINITIANTMIILTMMMAKGGEKPNDRYS